MTTATPAAEPQIAAVNILLVDDRPENLLALETILADLGQNLIRATSGREALRFLLRNEAALILLDVQMPELNGFELAEIIRGREQTQHTPIIFISAASRDEKYIFKGYSLGAVDYMTKPFEPEILKSKVRFFTKLFQQNQEIKRQAALLEKANAELDKLNAELEARVRQRTGQLETANRELENEIVVRKKFEARLSTEHAVATTLADAGSLEEAASPILKAFCEHLEADVSCLWLLTEENKEEVLSCALIETCRKPSAGAIKNSLAPFIDETRRLKLRSGRGLPGQIRKQNAPVYLPDLARAEKMPRAALAASLGLQSGIGFPIKFGETFYGVIEFFTRRQLFFDEQKIGMLESIGSEIGQFIQRKQIEAERESLLLREKLLREQAERASRLKDEFLATVSHELRTPLNAIIGWGQILQARDLNKPEQERALETICRNAKSQAQLIDDLLDTSRLITGNLRLNLSPTAVAPVIESALDVVRPAAEAKNVTLSTSYGKAAESEKITCDAQRLQQMVWNLLTNAVKFTPEGGRVQVRLKHTGEAIQIVVNDTGEGIEPEFLPHVFERFRQADGSSTRMHNGLGLGLAIVRHLAELHGGSVNAKSDGLGKGATFTITLPRTLTVSVSGDTNGSNGNSSLSSGKEEKFSEESGGSKSSELAAFKLKGLRVLIVDDDADTCEMLAFAVNQWGAETQSSTSVTEAFDSIIRWHPDVLLTDINMPGEDGYALIGRLRAMKSPKVANIPAIALTAMARPEDSERALSAGFQLHLTKPVDTHQLGAAIVNLTKKTK